MYKNRSTVLTVITCLAFLYACKKEKETQGSIAHYPKLPDTYDDYTVFDPPAHFDGFPLNFINSITHPITNEGATLGRVLFYDTYLSSDNQISCGSCHQQKHAFSDPAKFSRGVNGHVTTRHSMALFNTRYSNRFFWDSRSVGLEAQVLQPIQNPLEMGMDLTALEAKLSRVKYYPALFEAAFGSPEITSERISIALAMFVHSIYSYESKFDIAEQNAYANYTPLEKDGHDLFRYGDFNCGACHNSANFFDSQNLHNGLDSLPVDLGRGGVTGNTADIGKFKTVSLRNIAVTAPYMHDGRFRTLEEVVEHYNSGLQPHANLDDRLASNHTIGGPPRQMNMTSYEKQAIVAFLKTLTDEHLLKEKKWSDPFK